MAPADSGFLGCDPVIGLLVSDVWKDHSGHDLKSFKES